VDPHDAKRALRYLISDLRAISQKDQEQEVRGMALPVLDSVIEAAKEHVVDDPVVQTIRAVISPEAVAEGEPVRAIDAMIVAQQLLQALERHYPSAPLIA
jgi:hypothetical protein